MSEKTNFEGSYPDDTHTPAAEPVRSRSAVRSVFLVATCTSALIASATNSTCTAIALPTIGRDFGTAQDQLQWLVSAYTLSSGCLLILFGRLADLYGRKKVFMAGSAWTVAFSLGCAFAPDQLTLDVLRAFQGMGAAAMIPSAIGALAHAFPPSRARSIAFSTFAAGAPVGAGFGYALGGLLTQLSAQTWRSTYYLAAGLNTLSLLGAILTIDPDEPSTEVDQRVDWLGALLVTAGLVLVVFVLSGGEVAPQGWRTPYIIACLVVGVFLVVAFLFWQSYLERVQANPNAKYSRWTPPPLMKLSLWNRAHGKLAVVMLIAFLNWCCFLSWTFWMMLYYQDYVHLTPILTVVRMLPMVIVGIMCNVVVVIFVSRIPLVWIIVTGTACTGAAPLLFALINPSAPYWAFGFPAMVLSVFGADFVMASGSIFVAKVALPHEQSLAGALFQTMTQLGTSFGLTITTIIYDRISRRDATRMGSPQGSLPPSAELAGYRAAQWGALAFTVISAILAASFLASVGVVGHQTVKSTDVDDKPTSKSALSTEAPMSA